MKEITISKNIVSLRKVAGITQEQLATALNLSPQAVSKWEKGSCLPDILTLPLIAEYFHVSIDYLFYGDDITYDDIYEKLFQKVSSLGQFNGFEEALRLYAPIHHGLTCGNLRGKQWLADNPSHISGANGLSLMDGRGYGTLITRRYLEQINGQTAEFGKQIFGVLSQANCLPVVMSIVAMSDISYYEMKERLQMEDEPLQKAIAQLVAGGLITETQSKHQALGKTYHIAENYHTCLCIILATMEVQRESLQGLSCCMGYGDYPIQE